MCLRNYASKPSKGTPEFGKSFEHFILNNMEIAIEIKSNTRVHETDCKSLKALSTEYPKCKLVIVSLEKEPKNIDQITSLPWKQFLDLLWENKLLKYKIKP